MIRFADASGSGNLGMADSEDTWPEPQYNVGPAKHLHALGVISVCYNAFERCLADLYGHHLIHQKIPAGLTDLYYFKLDEDRRLKAINVVFRDYERDENVKAVVKSVIDYFEWAWDARNKLLHSEPYPSIFFQAQDRLFLSKRKSRTEPETHYLFPDLPTLRDIANKIEFGKRETAGVIIYLRARDTPSRQLQLWMKSTGPHTLPEKLERPDDLKLEPHPYNGPLPPPRRRSSPE